MYRIFLCALASLRAKIKILLGDLYLEEKNLLLEPIGVYQKVADGKDIEEDVLTFFFNLDSHGAHYP